MCASWLCPLQTNLFSANFRKYTVEIFSYSIILIFPDVSLKYQFSLTQNNPDFSLTLKSFDHFLTCGNPPLVNIDNVKSSIHFL